MCCTLAWQNMWHCKNDHSLHVSVEAHQLRPQTAGALVDQPTAHCDEGRLLPECADRGQPLHSVHSPSSQVSIYDGRWPHRMTKSAVLHNAASHAMLLPCDVAGTHMTLQQMCTATRVQP